MQYFKINEVNDEEDIISEILNRDLEFIPGEEFEYSDLGFILLKNIIEKSNRSDFENLASRWIYTPLNMNNTYFNPNKNMKNIVVPTEYDSVYRDRLVQGEVHDENAFMIGEYQDTLEYFQTHGI